MLNGGDGVFFGSYSAFLSTTNTAGPVNTKEHDLGFSGPEHFLPSLLWIIYVFTVLRQPWSLLEQQTLWVLQDLNLLWCSVLPVVLLDCGPVVRSLTSQTTPCGFGLIHHLCHDHSHVAWNWKQLTVIFFLPKSLLQQFSPSHKACWRSFSPVQVYSLVPDIIWQLFGLAHGGGLEETDSVDRCVLYT